MLPWLMLWLFLFLVGMVPNAQAQRSTAALQELNATTATWLRWLAVTQPERLPAQYRNLIPEQAVKCGTEFLLQLHANRASLSVQQRSILDAYLSRPDLTHAIVSPTGRFRIHYDTSGYNAVPSDDADQDGVPDYVQEAAKAFERAYRVIVDSLGYNPAPDDGGIDGPEYDVYILNLPALYGETVLENRLQVSPETYSSFIRVDNSFKPNSYFSPGLDGLRVTAAHEYFHAVQLGYAFRDEDIFYFEASSVWMEDVVYDDVNDYLQYLPQFFRSLDLPFNLTDGEHEYGLALWNKFLTRRWRDAGIIRDTWEAIRQTTAVQAIATVLLERGSTFGDMLTEFSLWNFFTGTRARPDEFYEEGDLYPEVEYAREIAVEVDTFLVDSTASASSRYYRFKTLVADEFAVSLQPDNPLIWKYSVVVMSPSGLSEFSKFNPGGRGALGRVESFADIVAIPTNTLVSTQAVNSYTQFARYPFELRLRRGPAISGVVAKLLPPRPHPVVVDGQQQAVFDFVLSQSEEVKVRILDAVGRRVWGRDFGFLRDGFNAFHWDGRDEDGRLVDSGVYLLQLVTPSAIQIGKFVVVRR
jgi:hypothetical protein